MNINELLLQFESFTHQGGVLLWAILLVAFIIFAISGERALYVFFTHPRQAKIWQQQWQSLPQTHTWSALRMREAMLAQSQILLNQTMWLLKSCVMVCPLLGLTGTVAGMISVFDNLSFTGSGNPRLMSSGIFQATIPTMAGMLVAIIGMVLRQQVVRLTQKKQRQFASSLAIQHQVSPQP